MIVDAHQHFWRRSRGDYEWLTRDFAAIFRDFEPDELATKLVALGIDKTIVVQAAATVDETLFLLDLADQFDFIAGVVGWVDMEASDAPLVIERLGRHPKLKGIRPMIQDIADDDWMLRSDLTVAFDAIAANGLRFDALVLPRHLPNLLSLLNRHADMPTIIDHGAKPQIAAGEICHWVSDIARIAAETDAYCKLSGLVSEAGDDPSIGKIRPIFAHLIEVFGPQRLIWGSDWPVVNMAMGYEDWWHLAEQLCRPLSSGDKRAIFGANACRFYGVDMGVNYG